MPVSIVGSPPALVLIKAVRTTSCHPFVCDAPEQRQASAPGVFGHEALPFFVFWWLVGEAHVAVRAACASAGARWRLAVMRDS